MTASADSASSFVLLHLGSRRFALPASTIAELAPPVHLHAFPHTSAKVCGVIVRRSRIVPVYDASPILIGRRSAAHRFYLIARREFGKTGELSAIPVDGECELVSGELQAAASDDPAYVKGRVAVGDDFVGVLDFEALVSYRQQEPENEAPAVLS
ncbi:MAG TPA: chemotaxis protein CheW [Candidatus Acidoferrum sp.]|nr:chemotaxis protein CheW [Candidatus Acidoferrum sp.]